MAHFAKIGIDNVVTGVLSMDTITTMTPGGIEREEVGIAHLIEHHGHENWKKCSYNTVNGVHGVLKLEKLLLIRQRHFVPIIPVLVGITVLSMIYSIHLDQLTWMGI